MKPTRDPPARCALPEVAYEPYDDGWPVYEESYVLVNELPRSRAARYLEYRIQ